MERILERWGPERSYTLPELDQKAGQRGADGGHTALEVHRARLGVIGVCP